MRATCVSESVWDFRAACNCSLTQPQPTDTSSVIKTEQVHTQENRNIRPCKNMCKNDHSSNTHSSQKVETIQMSMN
ncbi:hypothetical protein CK820_G0017364 [Pan troglodytes]|uniref:Uncharacterized protein n=1 Tax=Pan troglodytes TaxID=9598 RepID=A0A2J8MU53_PANTR|nr:hypothetical protein CK820_G0017364 [Pan troglodytes]